MSGFTFIDSSFGLFEIKAVGLKKNILYPPGLLLSTFFYRPAILIWSIIRPDVHKKHLVMPGRKPGFSVQALSKGWFSGLLMVVMFLVILSSH
jgi:hypothetical protein